MLDMARVLADTRLTRDTIAAFEAKTEADEFTDTGDAWDLLNEIRGRGEAILRDAGA